MSNLFKQLMALMPDPALQVGVVAAVSGGIADVTLPGGGVIKARGDATVGDSVFVRGGVIEGQAPSLSIVTIEV